MEKVTILAIDDNADNLIVLKALLTEAFPRIRFISAQSGVKGIELCRADKPDVVLLDIVMPGMDGYEVCQKLKTDPTTQIIPIVMITAARTDKESRIKALECGADAFLTKPVDESELTAQIRAMIRIKEAEDHKLDEKERLSRLVDERTKELSKSQQETLQLLNNLKAENEARRKMEEALQKSEEQLRGIFNNLQDAYFQANSSGLYTVVSPSAVHIYGYNSADEILGKPAASLYADPQDRISLLNHLHQKERIEDFVCQGKKKNGTTFWVSMNIQLLKDKNGNIVGTEGVVRDITERKLAEKVTKDNEKRFRHISNSISDISYSCLTDSKGESLIDWLYGATEKITGYTSDELFGMQCWGKLVIAEDFPIFRHHILEMKPGHSDSCQLRLKKKNGSIVWIHASAECVSDENDKKLARIYGGLVDITERMRSEEELHLINETHAAMISNIGDVIGVINPDGTTKYKSPNIETCFGWKPEELIGKDIWMMIHPYDLERIQNVFYALLKTEYSSSVIEFRYKCKDGSYKWVELSAVNQVNNPIIGGILINYHDITDRKTAEETLRESEFFFKESQRAAFIGSYKFNLATNHWTSSEVLEQIFGIEEDYQRDLQGWLNIGHPEDQKMMARYFTEEVVGKQKPFNKEYRIVRKKDGQIRWVHGLGKLDFNENKEIISMVGTIQDITERKQAEKALHDSNEFNDSLMKTIPFGMDIVDSEGNILFQSLSFRKLFGKELLGRKCWEIYRDDKKQCSNCPLLNDIQIGKTEIYESEGVLGGRTFEINHTGMMFNGKKALLEIFQDITDRKTSELSLKQSEDRYRSFISQVSEGVYRFESDLPMELDLSIEEQIDFIYDHFYIAECNDAFIKMYGFNHIQEMIGKGHLEFHGGRNNPVNRESMRAFIKNGFRRENVITEEKNPSGQRMIISNNSIGIIENNKLIRIWGTQTDITEKNLLEETQRITLEISQSSMTKTSLNSFLKEVHQKLSKILRADNFYVALYDKKTDKYTIPYHVDEMDKIDPKQVYHLKDGYTDLVRRTGKGQLITVDSKNKNTGVVGYGEVPSAWLGVPIKGSADGESIGVIAVQDYHNLNEYSKNELQTLEVVAKDICVFIERIKNLEVLTKAKEKAEESDRLKSAFLANMSHEIRTPLNSIVGFSDLLLDPNFNIEQHRQFAEIISTSGNNLLEIISDIVDISKIEAGQVQIQKNTISIHKLILDIQKQFSLKATQKGIELRLDPDNPIAEIHIENDEVKLKQILINFVGNALKFTAKGFVEIGFDEKENEIEFHIKDTGIGISAQHHSAIFERFRQVESADSRKYGGNGLGLAISKSLAELLGGKIRMKSEEGKGSVFYLTIPKRI